MPFVPVCVQGFNNNTNPLALAVEFAHAVHQHTHAPHRPRPAGPTALGSGGGGVGGVMGDWHTGIRGWGAADWGYARRGVGGGKVEENGHACLYIAAPAKGICGDAKKATPLADCSLTYPPVCIAAPAKKRGGVVKTAPQAPTD